MRFRAAALLPRIAAAALLAALSGCAYSTGGNLLPPHIKTVAIPVFENGTTEYTIEKDITDAVIARFISDNHLKVVDERVANSVIRGKVTAYRNAVFGFTGGNLATEYRVTITVAVTFKDLVKNREIWSDQELSKYSNYYVQSVPGQVVKTELDGRKDAIAKIADEILTRTVEGW
ncbi:MAG TPA: LptE family protein [Candidatus Sulfotelmatobacter sp.]|nr:LptE family protein [Candidatus Sulfotelmatobacter sp.]